MRARRRTLAGAAAVALLTGLSACAATPESATSPDACAPVASPGGATDAITASGEFGSSAAVSSPSPIRADGLQVARSGAPDGAAVTEHGVLEANVTVVSGEDGSEVIPYGPVAFDDDGETRPFTMSGLVATSPGLADALRCARAGERIVAAMPAEVFFGSEVAAARALPDTTLIAVADVTRVYPSSAWGTALPPAEGFPAVVSAPDGQPGVTMPEAPAPTTLRSSLTVDGFGAPVVAGDRTTIHVSVFAWESGEYLGSTWDDGNTVSRVRPEPGPTDDGLFGASGELVDRPVGSQVVIVVPADQVQAYPGPISSFRTSGQTVVLVVDVLASDPEENR